MCDGMLKWKLRGDHKAEIGGTLEPVLIRYIKRIVDLILDRLFAGSLGC